MAYEYIEGMLNSFFTEKARKSGINVKSILEVGCGRGEFVEHLRETGIEAYGIDLAPKIENKYIIQGDARNLEKYFDRKFDVIVANGVLCSGGQLEALSLLDYERTKKDTKENFNAIMERARENCITILKSCYEQLNAPGYFINQETNAEFDRIIYAKKDARRAGFKIAGFNQFCAVLIKKG